MNVSIANDFLFFQLLFAFGRDCCQESFYELGSGGHVLSKTGRFYGENKAQKMGWCLCKDCVGLCFGVVGVARNDGDHSFVVSDMQVRRPDHFICTNCHWGKEAYTVLLSFLPETHDEVK